MDYHDPETEVNVSGVDELKCTRKCRRLLKVRLFFALVEFALAALASDVTRNIVYHLGLPHGLLSPPWNFRLVWLPGLFTYKVHTAAYRSMMFSKHR